MYKYKQTICAISADYFSSTKVNSYDAYTINFDNCTTGVYDGSGTYRNTPYRIVCLENK